MVKLKTLMTALALALAVGQAQAAFMGRLADGTASGTCTVSGPDKCAMYYNDTLDITILNDWNIGRGFWSGTAAPGSAQALAETAGAAQTDFTGWFLPTGDGLRPAGPLNQYLSIWEEVGSSFGGLQGQFDGALSVNYWSGTEFALVPLFAWLFDPNGGSQASVGKFDALNAVAVRPGDVAAAAVPEPQTLTLTLLALGATLVARRRRLC